MAVVVLALGFCVLGQELPIQCTFKAVSGLPCMTCGGTRCLNAMFQGELVAAARFNPFVCCLSIIATALAMYCCVLTVFNLPRPRWTLTSAEKWPLLAICLIAVLANWIFLILDGR